MSASSRESRVRPESTPSAAPISPEVAAIGVGGALGASLRHALALAAGALGLHSAAGTLAANLAGAFLLGVLLTRFESPSAHPLLRPFWVIGVFGSFTTFSTLILEGHDVAAASHPDLALLHFGTSIALGLAAFALGHRLWRPGA
jgi:CrcB protein